jgi:pimeloyl-ACP methyl ester carboxylesterase
MNNNDIAVLAAAFLLGIGGVAATGPGTSLGAQVPAARTSPAGKPTIVLVHGAFADGTGWQRVIPILQRRGYTVVAAQNALNSLSDDVATTKRLIQAQTGPVVLVGHSYGGAIITGAGAGESNVSALVYIAAFAPDGGEPIGAFNATYPSDLGTSLLVDAAGYGTIDRAKFRDVFAADVSPSDARVMAATQKPASVSVFAASNPVAAWRTIPAWYLVSRQDRAISPDLERFFAKRMGAHTEEVNASHVAFISRPNEVVRMIEDAARSTATASGSLR